MASNDAIESSNVSPAFKDIDANSSSICSGRLIRSSIENLVSLCILINGETDIDKPSYKLSLMS